MSTDYSPDILVPPVADVITEAEQLVFEALPLVRHGHREDGDDVGARALHLRVRQARLYRLHRLEVWPHELMWARNG